MTTYDCEICGAVNSAKHLHCGSCGTIPAQYSVSRKPVRALQTDYMTRYIEVVRAYGSERQNQRRACRAYLRTVPLDYYATAEK